MKIAYSNPLRQGRLGSSKKGLSLICPAIEASARKTLQKQKINHNEFKQFLRDRYVIIEAFIGAGLNLEKTRFFDAVLETDDRKLLKEPDFADLVYHAFRCALAHGHEIAEKFTLIPSEAQDRSKWFLGNDGRLNMPDKVLWALVACVVFCKSNEDINTQSGCFLTWGGPANQYRFDVDVFWGGESIVKIFLAKQNLIRVAIV